MDWKIMNHFPATHQFPTLHPRCIFRLPSNSCSEPSSTQPNPPSTRKTHPTITSPIGKHLTTSVFERISAPCHRLPILSPAELRYHQSPTWSVGLDGLHSLLWVQVGNYYFASLRRTRGNGETSSFRPHVRDGGQRRTPSPPFVRRSSAERWNIKLDQQNK